MHLLQILTLIAHFPPLEVEHCVVVGKNGQIELHRHNSLSVHLAGAEEVHSEDCGENMHANHTHHLVKLGVLLCIISGKRKYNFSGEFAEIPQQVC